jgi:enterochelin esterase-like enzyme
VAGARTGSVVSADLEAAMEKASGRLLRPIFDRWTGGLGPEESPPWREASAGPRLLALRKQVEGGDTAALERFWGEVKKEGAPLVETVASDPGHVLVTFLWRGQPGTNAVLLAAPLWATRPTTPGIAMERLLATDVWYKTYLLDRDLRFSYTFMVDPPSSAGGAPPPRVADPLNPRASWTSKDEEDPTANANVPGGSIFEGPGAPAIPESLTTPATAHGALTMERLASEILGNERRIWIYTPPGYDPAAATASYPVVVCFDGFWYADTNSMALVPTLDALISAGRLPPTIALLVDTPSKWRRAELSNNPAFVQFLADELLPWARRKWRVTSDPAQTVVTGVSLGGLTSAFAAFRRPDVFGNVLSLSGAFWRGSPTNDNDPEWLTHELEKGPKLPVKFVLQTGRLEMAIPASNGGPPLGIANRHLRDVLRARGYDLHYSEFPGAHEPLSWRNGTGEGLVQLIGSVRK